MFASGSPGGSLAQQVGATSFIGAANGLGVIRQGAPIVVALLLAGAVGSAICSDLGARTIREDFRNFFLFLRHTICHSDGISRRSINHKSRRPHMDEARLCG